MMTTNNKICLMVKSISLKGLLRMMTLLILDNDSYLFSLANQSKSKSSVDCISASFIDLRAIVLNLAGKREITRLK